MLNHDLVLKRDELYLVGNATTDGDERASGLYFRDTRYLDHFSVSVNDTALKPLSVRALGPDTALIVEANDAFTTDAGERVPPMTIALEQHVSLAAGLRVQLVVRNFSGRALTLRLAVSLGVDFHDLFAIRGFPRANDRGSVLPVELTPGGFSLRYHYLGGETARTDVAFSGATVQADARRQDGPEPRGERLTPDFDAGTLRTEGLDAQRATVILPLTLASREAWAVTVTITPQAPPASRVAPARHFTAATSAPATIVTDNQAFNRILVQAAADLRMLETSFPEGTMPAAGVPWYVAPFGRDSLIVGLQTLHLAPSRAVATLRLLASCQGVAVDHYREEEPGKILHEVRYGELARQGQIPHTPYFGTIDATPLFLLLCAETIAWTGDDHLYAELLPHIERALDWVELYGDLDGDGLIEYLARDVDGQHIVHQTWKDSHDSLNDRDGRPITGVITPVEVQGYLYAAYQSLATVAATRNEQTRADTLRARAEVVRQSVEARFWLEDVGFYAQALDDQKAPVRALSSNPGHLLYCGLPAATRAQAVAVRMRQPDFDSGWGIRTLSEDMPSYNPMSYHNGSVWSHDNSLIAAGCQRYGLASDTNRIATALFAVAAADPLARLPELYCGFARSDAVSSNAPVVYPVSCSPQAWAAAASQLLVRSMLGLEIDVHHRVLLVAPALPAWLNDVQIRDLCVFGQPAAVTVRRAGDGYTIETTGPVAVAGEVAGDTAGAPGTARR